MISKYTATVKELLEKDLTCVVTKTIDNEENSIYDILPGKTVKPIDLFTYYSIFGSNNRYLKYIDAPKTVKENLINMLLRRDSLFINETESILKIELRTLQVYNMILSVISKGSKTLSEISEKLGLPTSICNKYTTVLINLGILNKIKPVYDNDTRKSEYEISNKLMDFYYYFVLENMDEISIEKEDRLFDEKIAMNMDSYLANKFSLICREYILKQIMEEKNPMTIIENGKWWDKEDKIDVVIGDGVKATFANCFWNESIIGIDELVKLENASKKINVADRKYYIFAKKGFSDELKKIAKKRDDLELIDFSTIFEGKKKFLFFK
jgi:predicted transcriptional regulator